MEAWKLETTLYLVVPCYNEEAVLHDTAKRLGEKMKKLASEKKISDAGKIVFVDDGSRDGTWGIISDLCAGDRLFAGIKLSRNRGHQHALFAGLMTVRSEADAVISIDADLQDDIGAIDSMVDEYLRCSDIVYGVRKSRKKDGFMKRVTAEGYYRLLQRYGCDTVFNHADFRLMSSRSLAALSEFGEQRLYLRGLVPLLGFKTSVVEYERGVREAGESKYPLKRMLSLAFDGLMSLSLRPLRLVTATGALMLVFTAALLVYSLLMLFLSKQAPELWYITASIWGAGGIIVLSLGVVGEYVGRTFIEVKRRPKYFIDKTTGLVQSQVELRVES